MKNDNVLKKKRGSRSFNTNSKVRNLDPSSAGAFNVYRMMALRIKPQLVDNTLELETLPRVNQIDLKPGEKEQFIEAFKTIIRNGQFADLITIHTNVYQNRIHTEITDVETNQRFLPWHRVFLHELERRLNSTPEGNSKIRIPYWDWTVHREIPDWLEDFRPKIDKVLVFPPPVFPPRTTEPVPVIQTIRVQRAPGQAVHPVTGRRVELPTKPQVGRILSQSRDFREFTAALEGLHGLPHVWVGGTMAQYVSPADPLFWLHHSNIDRLWDSWPKSQSQLPNLQGSDAEMTPWSYRTDTDPIHDTKYFNYTYK
jgi:tyrosinase